MDNPILEWALKYRKHQFSVIPVGKDKKPLIDWKHYQSSLASEEEIKSWFDKKEPPNIGIVTGKISGVVVVDVEAGGKWKHYPPTMSAKTGGGGVHLYYKYADVQNRARVTELTDIRGNGGYVVAPPSKHASGANYEWFRKEAPQPFPFALFNLQPEEKKDWGAILKGVGQGNRNQTAAEVAGKFLHTIDPLDWMSVAWPVLVLWNQSNQPPLPENELRATFNSIMGREARQRKERGGESEIKLLSEVVNGLSDDITISYPTHFKVFDDNFMGGLKEGDLIFVTGLTGIGKSTLAQSMSYNLNKDGQPILWFSFEVPYPELWRKFKDMGVENNFNAYVPENLTSNNVEWIKKKIIEARDRYKTKVVFVDHLGFLAPDMNGQKDNVSSNYATYLTMICRQLKRLAVSEGVAIVLLGHVRKPSNSHNDEPNLHDIKDSSGVGQEADGVLIMHRKRTSGYSSDDIYEPDTIVKIEKNRRTGRNKMFKVSFVKGRLVDEEESIDLLVNST